MRVVWIMTDWFRSDAYYQSGGWRHLKGEGGGVLLNQCLHQLDAMQWMVGMPSKVNSQVGIGKWHDIEVEDGVSCYMEFPDGIGSLPYFHRGNPGATDLRFPGRRDACSWRTIDWSLPATPFLRTSGARLPRSGSSNLKQPSKRLISPRGSSSLHLDEEFHGRHPQGEFDCSREEGLGSVELANAMLYSGLLEGPLELPMDGEAWEKKLNELIETSTHEKKVVELSGDDFSASFRR